MIQLKFRLIMKILFIILAMCFIVSNLNSADIHSTKVGGNWDDINTWVGGTVPGKGDNAFIESKVVARKDACSDSIWVELDCRLEILNNTTVTCRSFTMKKENGFEGKLSNYGTLVVDISFNTKEEEK